MLVSPQRTQDTEQKEPVLPPAHTAGQNWEISVSL
jgi:hypothetical protein